MVQPMTSGPCAFWNDPIERRAAPTRPTLTTTIHATRRRARRAVPVALYVRRAQILLAAAMLLGAAGATGVGLWRVVFPAAPAPVLTVTRTVQPGDSLWALARRFGDPGRDIRDRVDALARANGLSSTASLLPGQKLVVPVANPAEAMLLRSTVAASGTVTRQ